MADAILDGIGSAYPLQVNNNNAAKVYLNVSGTDVDNNTPLPVSDYLTEIAREKVSTASFIAKFGENPDIDVATAPEDIWDFGGEYTFSTTADIDTVSSSNAGDTQVLIIYGLDTNYNDTTQVITLDGQNEVTLGTNLIRVYRMINAGSVDFAGTVYCYVGNGSTDGVPDNDVDVRAIIINGNNQTLMAIYTVPAGKTGRYVHAQFGMVRALSTNYAEFETKARPFGSVFQVKAHVGTVNTGNSIADYRLGIAETIPEKTDLKMTCIDVSANGTAVFGLFDVYLEDN